jgi:hypothetical protein
MGATRRPLYKSLIYGFANLRIWDNILCHP